MKTSTLSNTIFATLLIVLPVHFGFAEETIYGWQLMTEQERIEHRNKMRSLKTKQEREAYRIEHHKRMQERARERGVTLPDTSQQRGKGMRGPASGTGQGKGGGAGRYR